MAGIGGFKPNITPTERNIAKGAGIGALAGGAALGPVGAAAGAAAGAAIEAVKEISKKDTSNIKVNQLNSSKTPVKEVSFDLDKKEAASPAKEALKSVADTLGNAEKITENAMKKLAEQFLNAVRGQNQ